jgi:LysM repeat protein
VDEAQGGPGQLGDGGRDPDAGSRSPYRTTCPYFRREGPDGELVAPFERADGANRCVALGPPIEPSLRQQAMACLSPEHTECPRFVHAETTPREAVVRVQPRPTQPRSRPELAVGRPGPAARRRSRATIAALLLLLASATTSFAFVLARGGLTMPAPAPSSQDAVAAATGTSLPTAVAVVATPDATPSPTPRPTPSPSPTPTATPAPTPKPTPAPTAKPQPTSSRYAYLDPCPSKPNCWIYTIRSGDALYNLARYFGHSIETIYRLNPWTKVRGIQPGDQLILPPPTL